MVAETTLSSILENWLDEAITPWSSGEQSGGCRHPLPSRLQGVGGAFETVPGFALGVHCAGLSRWRRHRPPVQHRMGQSYQPDSLLRRQRGGCEASGHSRPFFWKLQAGSHTRVRSKPLQAARMREGAPLIFPLLSW